MKVLQLVDVNGNDMLASDGIWYVDGRWNIGSIISDIRNRNDKMMKNYPHRKAYGFKFFKGNHIRNGSEGQHVYKLYMIVQQ